jgi:hypothetical protein
MPFTANVWSATARISVIKGYGWAGPSRMLRAARKRANLRQVRATHRYVRRGSPSGERAIPSYVYIFLFDAASR